jgi:hypothetical protein
LEDNESESKESDFGVEIIMAKKIIKPRGWCMAEIVI